MRFLSPFSVEGARAVVMKRNKRSDSELGRHYPKGSVLEARVSRVTPFCVIVDVDGGAKGIIRKREMSWEIEPEHPGEILNEGQKVRVRVLGVDQNWQRLKLSLRQAEKDPWRDINRRYRAGQVVSCRVTGLLQKRAFLELEPAITGYVPLHEICKPEPEHIENVLWRGDMVEAIITRLDPARRRIELSIKQHRRSLERQRVQHRYLHHGADGGASLGELLGEEGRRKLLDFIQRSKGFAKSPGTANEALRSTLARQLHHILLADDDPSFRVSLQRLLHHMGHEVTTVDSAATAVSLCAKEKFDLLLIDLGFNSGDINGLQAVRAILAQHPKLPAIVITGFGLSSDYRQIIAETRESGARGLTYKPVDFSRLSDLMLAIAEGRDGWNERHLTRAVGEINIGHDYMPTVNVAHQNFLVAIHHELAELQQQTGASAGVVFQMVFSTREVRVLVHAGTPLTRYGTYKYRLQATPIREVIELGKDVFETDIVRNPRKFQYLNLLDYTSCIGVPVKTLGRTEYGLFLFHPQKGHFTHAHLSQAHVCAKLIGAIFARDEAERIVQRVQPFVFAGQIGSTLTHELNNRLGSIANITETLKLEDANIEKDITQAGDPLVRQKIKERIQELETNNKAVGKLTTLYMGLLNKERQELVNINELIHRAWSILAPIAEREQIEIFLELEEDLPSTLTVGVWLEQVFVNIVLNAIQNIRLTHPEGEILIQSRFVKSHEQLPLQVRFTDTGPGIHGQNIEHIFELGFSTRPEGTGLGLFTAKRLVESLRGRISVERSVILVGTTFLIELPLIMPSMERAAS